MSFKKHDGSLVLSTNIAVHQIAGRTNSGITPFYITWLDNIEARLAGITPNEHSAKSFGKEVCHLMTVDLIDVTKLGASTAKSSPVFLTVGPSGYLLLMPMGNMPYLGVLRTTSLYTERITIVLASMVLTSKALSMLVLTVSLRFYSPRITKIYRTMGSRSYGCRLRIANQASYALAEDTWHRASCLTSIAGIWGCRLSLSPLKTQPHKIENAFRLACSFALALMHYLDTGAWTSEPTQ